METGGSSCVNSHNLIPGSFMEAVRRTSRNIEDVEANLQEFLSFCDKETLFDLEPLERANVLFLIAKANTTLFALRLRCNGMDPDDHLIKKEFERLRLYEEKLNQCMDLNKAPLRPSTTVNSQAAARFIEHSLPDLSREKKQSMREVTRGSSRRINYLERTIQNKRKHQASEKQSVCDAAHEFLEKASRELLGDNKNVTKGPLRFQPEDSGDES